MGNSDKRFYYIVWCPACWDDKYGCFEGGKERSEESYETAEEAKQAAEDFIGDVIWEYEIKKE